MIICFWRNAILSLAETLVKLMKSQKKTMGMTKSPQHPMDTKKSTPRQHEARVKLTASSLPIQRRTEAARQAPGQERAVAALQ